MTVYPDLQDFRIWNIFKRQPIGLVRARTKESALTLAQAAHPRTRPDEIFVTPVSAEKAP